MSERPASSPLTDDLVHALDTLVRVVERQSREFRDFRASVLIVSDDGTRLIDAAAPSLPSSYREAVDGLEIGPAMGSCGTAAHRGARVIVMDTQEDPLWESFRDLAREHGLAACWSQPILSPRGQVLGTFAMYYSEPRVPGREELEIIEAAARRAETLLEQFRRGATREELVAGLT